MSGSMSMGGISPQIQALLAAMQSRGAAPGASAPAMGGANATPLSAYIGAPGGGGAMMQHPAMPPVAGNPAPATAAAGSPGTAQLMQLLANLKGGQTGILPGQQTGMTPNGQPTGALPGGGAGGAMAGMAPATLASQMSGAMPIGAAGSPTMGMTPQGPPAMGGAQNPGMLQWLLQRLQGNGQMPGGTGG